MEANSGSSEVRKDHSRCLVGKFMTKSTRVTIDKELKEDLQNVWRICCLRGFDVFPIGKGLILVEFELKRDMKNVVDIPIWVAKGQILLVKEWPSVGSVAEIDFSRVNISVRIKGLPLSRYTQEEARAIGKRLSSIPLKGITIDPSRRLFLVRAEIDVEKPLNPGYFIGKQRKKIFIQFKYRFPVMVCRYCGMIDHTNCTQRLKESPLTRNIKRPMYGEWMNDVKPEPADAKLVIEFPEKLVDEWIELEETVPYPQFFINLEVAYVCGSEHEWRGKKLFRYNLEDVVEHGFRFPTSYLTTTLEVLDDDPYQVLARKMEENVPLVGLTFEDKLEIVRKFVDYTMKRKDVWSRRRWVQVKICVIKTTKMVSCVDFQTMLQERKDEEYNRALDQEIREMIQRRVDKDEDIVSMELWRRCIQEVVGDGRLMPFNLEKRCIEARREAIEYGMSLCSGLEPATATETDKIEKRKVSGHEMDELEPCAICQEGMFLGEEATRMPCSHVFHATCIKSWLRIDNICPLCRRKPTQKQRPCPPYLQRYRLLKQRYL